MWSLDNKGWNHALWPQWSTDICEYLEKIYRVIRGPQCVTELVCIISWWRHQMETFVAILALCAGNSPVTGEFPSQRPVTGNFDVFFDLRLNKRLSKQPWSWWFGTPSHPLWRHCNAIPPELSWILSLCNTQSLMWDPKSIDALPVPEIEALSLTKLHTSGGRRNM